MRTSNSGGLVSEAHTPTHNAADTARRKQIAQALPVHVDDRATLVRVAALPLEDPGHLDAAGVESVARAHGQLNPPTEPPLAGTRWPRVGTGE
jgi:hypothetical protein